MMKKFKFIMEDGEVLDIIAPDFRAACQAFDKFGKDPRNIVAVESRTTK